MRLIGVPIAILLPFLFIATAYSQCIAVINSLPYREGFENNDGGWLSGGMGNDWAWGSPNKTVINGAGAGNKCWITGGLGGGSYTNAEASWLKSPCFDLSAVQYPRISMKLFWDTEQQYDGASLQYSIDNGINWVTIGSSGEATSCIRSGNWFNTAAINYLNPLTNTQQGWSGNTRTGSGSCRGGGGSGKWVDAYHTIPAIAGRPHVIFRFLFGAGNICNNYDGFAVDEIEIANAPANQASFGYSCIDSFSIQINNTSAHCPDSWSWNFGDPASGTENSATIANPVHRFSGPGNYTITLNASGPDNAPSTAYGSVSIAVPKVVQLTKANCQTNTGGSATVELSAIPAGSYTVLWSSVPVQSGPTASNLSAGNYIVRSEGARLCPAETSVQIELDDNCGEVWFPSAFTPNKDGVNDVFGPLGGRGSMQHYRLHIFNRWGQVVFETRDPYANWNGQLKGTNATAGVYSWLAEFNVAGKPTIKRSGMVVLIR